MTAATRNGRTLIGVVLNTWDDSGWSSYLLDQGFTMAADAPGTGDQLPAVRTVSADQRRAALMSMPGALGTAALDGTKPVAATSDTAPVTTPTTKKKTEPTTSATKAKVPAESRSSGGSDGGQLAATSTAATSGSGSGIGSMLRSGVPRSSSWP